MVIGIIIGLLIGGIIGVLVMSCLFVAKRSDSSVEIELLHQEIESLRKMIDDRK